MNIFDMPCSATAAEIAQDSMRDAQDVIQAEREAEAGLIDWILHAESVMATWTDRDWADQLSELSPTKLGNIGLFLAHHFTVINLSEGGMIAAEIFAEDTIKAIRANQAALARDHYLDTGELA